MGDSEKGKPKAMQKGFGNVLNRLNYNIREDLDFPNESTTQKYENEKKMQIEQVSVKDEGKTEESPDAPELEKEPMPETDGFEIEEESTAEPYVSEIEEKCIESFDDKIPDINAPPLTTIKPKRQQENLLNAYEFFKSPLPEDNNTGKLIHYRIKTFEEDIFDDLMLIRKTSNQAEVLKWIVYQILKDYECIIKEETQFVTKIEASMTNPQIKNLEDSLTEEDKKYRKKRLAYKGLFICPPVTRKDGTTREINCQLSIWMIEMISLLMNLLNADKTSQAYRWIMDTFIEDYGPAIEENSVMAKKARDILAGKM